MCYLLAIIFIAFIYVDLYFSCNGDKTGTVFTSTMSLISKAPIFKPFTLALIQLGGTTANKANNLKHARESILKAATNPAKPQVVVLPVRILALRRLPTLIIRIGMLQFALWAPPFPRLR